MPESKRLGSSDASSEVDEAAVRTAQIDTLLDEGLDRYFAARYEEAIHLWTRVLFFDRNHARARAYIESARKTVAEMQRHSEQLLATSRDLLEQGDTQAARRLLTEAIATSADDLQVAALRVRLERMERVRGVGEAVVEPAEPTGVVERWRWGRTPWIAVAGSLVLVAIAGIVAMSLQAGVPALPPSGAAPTIAPAIDKVPVLTTSEVALVRARTAVAHGRLSDSLKELDRVSLDSPDRPAADQLRIEVQQLLMASVRSASVTSFTERVKR